MKKDVKLCSIYFPFYALIMLDWKRFLPMLPINLAVTALVLYLILHYSKVENKKHILKQTLLPCFGYGLLADVFGVFFRALPLLLELLFQALGMTGVANFFGKYLSDHVIYNIYLGPVFIKLVWTVLSIAFAGLFVFLLNDRLALKKAVADAALRRRMALILALSTAPWAFMCPFF